jgi:hypothetical protein
MFCGGFFCDNYDWWHKLFWDCTVTWYVAFRNILFNDVLLCHSFVVWRTVHQLQHLSRPLLVFGGFYLFSQLYCACALIFIPWVYIWIPLEKFAVQRDIFPAVFSFCWWIRAPDLAQLPVSLGHWHWSRIPPGLLKMYFRGSGPWCGG